MSKHITTYIESIYQDVHVNTSSKTYTSETGNEIHDEQLTEKHVENMSKPLLKPISSLDCRSNEQSHIKHVLTQHTSVTFYRIVVINIP